MKYQVFAIKYQVFALPGIRYEVPGIRYEVPGIRYEVPGIRFSRYLLWRKSEKCFFVPVFHSLPFQNISTDCIFSKDFFIH